jgi:DNA-binding CsgD family transcriptional regulator
MMAEVVAAIGTDHFYGNLYRGLQQQFRACEMMVHRHTAAHGVELLANEAGDPCLPRSRAESYISKLHSRDPFASSLTPTRAPTIEVRHVAASQIRDLEYRRVLFCAKKLSGQLSLIVRGPEGASAISLFRSDVAQPFTEADRQSLSNQAEVLAAALERHCALDRQSPGTFNDIMQYVSRLPVDKALSEREAAVCAHVALGDSNWRIAEVMSISFHSVSTYRRRAYAKLGISSQAELLGLLIRRPSPSAHKRTASNSRGVQLPVRRRRCSVNALQWAHFQRPRAAVEVSASAQQRRDEDSVHLQP